jgi:hypothetical protein
MINMLSEADQTDLGFVAAQTEIGFLIGDD